MSQPAITPITEISTDLRQWTLRVTAPTTEWLFDADSFGGQPELLLRGAVTLDPAGARRDLAGEFKAVLRDDAMGLATLLEAFEEAAAELVGELSVLPGEVLARGVLGLAIRDGAVVELRFAAGVPRGAKPICRNVREIPELAALKGDRYLPQVFGQGDTMAVPLFELQESTLRDSLANDGVSLRLARPVDWPASGRLQVDDEVIVYENFVAGSDTIGSSDWPLERARPSAHRARARVVLLPAVLDWCVADHVASVQEIRSENELGNPVEGGAVMQRTLGGLPCTVFRCAQLPVVVTPGRTATTRETARSSAQWAILPDTTAVESGDAFNESSPARGAILSGPGPRILASYTQDLTRESGRFDELRGAALSFEFSDTPNWGAATRLRVRITKGMQTAEVLVDRDGVLASLAVEGIALMPRAGRAPSRAESTVHHFDRVVGEGPWTGLESAIDGRFQAAAVIVAAPEAAALEAQFVRARPEFPGRLLSFVLRVHLRNATPSAITVGLVGELPERLSERGEWSLATGEVTELALAVTVPSDVTAEELFGSGRFRLEVPAAASVEVLEMWLETKAEVATPAAVPSDLLQLPLVAQASVGVRVTYNRAVLDVSALLPAEPWKFFSPDGGNPLVEILLVEPPQDADWSVFLRDVHWNLTVIPATGARPVERLWARVNGRAVRADGTANPAEVAAILFGDGAFGAVPPGQRDSDSIASAVAESAARGIGLRAVYRDSTLLEQVLARVLAEGLLAAGLRRGKWALWTVPVQLEGALSPMMPRLELLEPAGAAELPVMPSGTPPKLQLATTGVDLVKRHFAARRSSGWGTEVAIDARMLGLMPGMAFTFADGWLAEVEQVRLKQGALAVRFAPRRQIQDYYNTNVSRVRRTVPAHDLLFFVGTKVVAKLTRAGDLLLRGTVREQGLAPAASPVLVVYHSSGDFLAINFFRNVVDYTAISIDGAGNLRTAVPVREGVSIADPAPAGVGAMGISASLLGGAPGHAAAMRLDLESLSLRGRILTQRDL